MGCFRANADDGRGIVGNAGIIQRETDGMAEGCTSMVGGIPRGIHEDRRERVDPPKLVVGDLHQDGEKCLPDRQEIVVSGLSVDGGKGVPP